MLRSWIPVPKVGGSPEGTPPKAFLRNFGGVLLGVQF